MKQQPWLVVTVTLFSIALALLLGACGPTGGTSAHQAISTPTVAPTSAPTSTALPTAARGEIVEAVRRSALPISGSPRDYDVLMDLVGDAQFVLLGEATHGTTEFYRERARITQRLIKEKGFTAIAVEGDWAEAYRVNRYIRDYPGPAGEDTTPEEALAGFTSFPRWMWANTEVRELVRWLREYNKKLPPTRPAVGFYGLDLYNIKGSARAVMSYLGRDDPQAVQQARERYLCALPDLEDVGTTIVDQGANGDQTCRERLQAELDEMQHRAAGVSPWADPVHREELFSTVQNARVVVDGSAYLEAPYDGPDSSWNVRDRHMVDTLDALAQQMSIRGRQAKIVVWAHNTHVGDARATQFGRDGLENIGQLVRERHKGDTVLVGFSTFRGSVRAATAWDEPGIRWDLNQAEPESDAALFHDTDLGDFLLQLRGTRLEKMFSSPMLQRAVGVIYSPTTERTTHYFEAELSRQFDALIYIDRTNALEPLKWPGQQK
ncbi:MAG TPA: erythromycin esterase family protein [Chloroflexia bacterium]|nr:erythromycin esterase family protein [Chloroflexia bacterium]